MQIRIKAGGPTSVISAADAKKMGLKITAPPPVKPEKKIPGSKEEKKTNKENADKPGDKKTVAGTKLKAAG